MCGLQVGGSSRGTAADESDSTTRGSEATARRGARRSIVGGFQFLEAAKEGAEGGERGGAEVQRRHRMSVFEQAQGKITPRNRQQVEREDGEDEERGSLTLQHLDSRRRAMDGTVRDAIGALTAEPHARVRMRTLMCMARARHACRCATRSAP